MSRWVTTQTSGRRFGRRGRRGSDDEYIDLDRDKSAAANVHEVLLNICARSGVTNKKKSGYLSALVNLLTDLAKQDPLSDIGLRIREILLCLRIPLTSDCMEVRAGALRAVRYLVQTHLHVHAVTAVNMHFLIARSLDIDLHNKPERIQAVRLVRRLLILGPNFFPPALAKSLISIVEKGGKDKQRDILWRVSLALLCELSNLNPDVFVSSGCVKILTHALMDCGGLYRVAEAVIGCLLRIYNSPKWRYECGLDLSIIVAPFTELHYIHNGSGGSEDGRVDTAGMALLSIIRSYPGLLHLSDPSSPTRPLQALVDILYLPSYDTRRLVLDILYQSLSLQVPEWTDEFDVALRTADPLAFRPSWKLSEGFVAAEGRDLLPHLAKSRPNLVENHLCLLLSCYLNCNLPAALVKVIVTSDTVLSVRGTVLLGQLLHAAATMLPHEIAATSHCLPQLAEHIKSDHNVSSAESNRAAAAVSALQRLHCIKKRRLVPHSLLLEQVLESSGYYQGDGFVGDRLAHRSTALGPVAGPNAGGAGPGVGDAAALAAVKESQVVPLRDPQAWRWDLIAAVLKWPSEAMRKLEDSNCRLFIKKITDYYKPSSNMFSRLELDSERTKFYARIACYLLDFLVSASCLPTDIEGNARLDDLLEDVLESVDEVVNAASPHDCVLSPTRLTNTASQQYFMFIGRLSRTDAGRNALDRHQALSRLKELMAARTDLYLKLVISCLDYRTSDWGSRLLLTKALQSSMEAGRLYSTRWLGVLARARAPSFAMYGVEMLVEQLKDKSMQVACTALNILDEVCDDKMFLESLVAAKSALINPAGTAALDNLGDRGKLLLTRFLGSASGFKLMSRTSWLTSELTRWADGFSRQYVLLVEAMLCDGFSLHQRGEDGHGTYGRRTGDPHAIRDVYLPPHIYGQLAQTESGLELVLQEPGFGAMVTHLRDIDAGGEQFLGDEEEWLEAKAAIWGLAHVASSPVASSLLEQEQGVISSIINIAETCPVLTIRATAYFALGLVATTRPGAMALGEKGWACVRHGRGEPWPIAPEYQLPGEITASPANTVSPAPSRSDDWDIDDNYSSRDDVQDVREVKEKEGGGGKANVIKEQKEKSKNRKSKYSYDESERSSKSTMLEIGLSPVDATPFTLPSRLPSKFASFFRSLDNGKGDSKASRRNSEGANSGLANKIRNSFRHRTRTISGGSGGYSGSRNNSKESTPVTKPQGDPEEGDDNTDNSARRRKLSFSPDESDQTATPASPEDSDMMFALENIVEEPTQGTLVTDLAQAALATDLAAAALVQGGILPDVSFVNVNNDSIDESSTSGFSSASSSSQVIRQANIVPVPKLSPIPSIPSVTSMDPASSTAKNSSCFSDDVTDSTLASSQTPQDAPVNVDLDNLPGGLTRQTGTNNLSVHPMSEVVNDTVNVVKDLGTTDVAHSDIVNPSADDDCAKASLDQSASLDESLSTLAYPSSEPSATPQTLSTPRPEPALLGIIRGGTSVSSVSSLGSVSYYDNPGYSTLIKGRNRRRPNLSESEDGDPVTSTRIGSVSRSDSWRRATRSLDYRPRRQDPPAVDPVRAFSVPPRPALSSGPRLTTGPREPAYWGIAFPLTHNILYPHPPHQRSSSLPPLELPGVLGAWLQDASPSRHAPDICLGCYKLRPSPRPRACSLTASAKDELGQKERHLSSSLPASHQSPSLPRPSWGAQAEREEGAGEGVSLAQRTEARQEALKLVGTMNSSVGTKGAEQNLLKIKRIIPEVFTDLCLYSEVAQVLADYHFKLPTRRFIQELFLDVNFSPMDGEARIILGLE